jgi:hypothetical protein
MQIDDGFEDFEEVEPTRIQLTEPQFELVTTDKQFPAMVAGFGAGKTNALVQRLSSLKIRYPRNNVAYYLPTYDLVNTIAIPRFQEVLETFSFYEGRDYKINKAEKMINLHDAGSIILRTMDNPGRIVGYEVGHSGVDELDTLKQKDATSVWQKILARNRQKLFVNVAKENEPDRWIVDEEALNTIAVGTTPEGFRFVYDRWKKNPPNDQYHIIEASTYSNARNLPADYIANLIADYPPNLIQAYLEGKFINLTSGAVYPEFDRVLNGCQTVIAAGEPLHIGMDFNVGNMAGVVFVARNGEPHAAAEVMKVLDTPAMIKAIKARWPNNPIFVYPDASGDSRKSNNASETDLALLRNAGFTVLNNTKNPFIRDRVLAVNIIIHSGQGPTERRRLKVNCDQCPAFAEALEKQAYTDKGEPDKTSGLDHAADAGGYFIAYRFPVENGRVQMRKISGT